MRKLSVRCPECGKERPLGYAAVWAITHGLNSGACNACAVERRRRPLIERVLAKVGAPDENGCWTWMGQRDKRGYGRLTNGSSRLAHRLVYTELRGPIPDGLVLDHLCRNPWCVNPDHLEPVTNAENVRRAAEADRKDTCPAGHVFDDRNTYIDPRGYRKCRACRREKNNAAYHAKRQASCA